MQHVFHFSDVIMRAMASQITDVSVVCSTVSPDKSKKHQRSASLASVRGIHRSAVDFPHKGPVMWKMFPFDDVIMTLQYFATQVIINIQEANNGLLDSIRAQARQHGLSENQFRQCLTLSSDRRLPVKISVPSEEFQEVSIFSNNNNGEEYYDCDIGIINTFILIVITSLVSTVNMLTSSNGNIFRITGAFCGEFTGHRWIPLAKASDAELGYFLFFNIRLNKRLSKQSRDQWLEVPSDSSWRHCNDTTLHHMTEYSWESLSATNWDVCNDW